MKQPIAGVAGLFAAGIVLGTFWTPPLPLLFALAFAAGLLAVVGRHAGDGAMIVFLILAGWFHVGWRTMPLRPSDLRNIVDVPEALATVEGRLVRDPEHRLRERDGGWLTNTLAVVECAAIRIDNRPWQRAAGRVVVRTPGIVDPAFRASARVLISGVLQHPSGPAAPGLFDYAEYLRWRGIHHELRAPASDDWQLVPGALPPPASAAARFQAWAQRTMARGLPAEEEELRLLRAMVLGWKTALTDEVEEPFMRSGTMHIFAISGLHIALLAAIAVQTLRLLALPRAAIGVMVLPLIWFYTAATGWQPSAVRATLMTSAVVGTWILARPTYILNSLAAAGLVVLLWDPRQLFHAGFQLSFAVVAAMAWLLPLIEPLRRRLCEIDPMLPPGLVPPWRRWLRRVAWSLLGLLAVSTAAWIGSIPLGAHHFHLITLGSVFANMLVVPLSAPALAASMGSLACGTWAPFLSELFNHTAWLCMHLMLRISRHVAELPGACWNVRTPPISAIALWYLVLAALGMGWWRRPRVRVAVGAMALALACHAAVEFHRRHGEERIVVIPSRGGHSIWVRDRRGSMLIDTCDASAAEALIHPFLQAQGVNRLDAIALTHGDVRHVGGAPLVAERFAPRTILASAVRFRSTAYRDVITALRARPESQWKTAASPERFMGWIVRHPGDGESVARADDGCVVLDHADSSVLLLGDLGPRGQESLLRRHPDLRAEIVITGVPDSGEPAGNGLLRRIQPRLVIIADSRYPATARASRKTRDRLEAWGGDVIYTSRTGAIELRRTAAGWRAFDARGEPIP